MQARSISVAALGDVADIDRVGVDPSSIKAGTLFVGLENITGDGTFKDVKPVEAGGLASTKFKFSPAHILYGKLRPYLRKVARPHFTGICSTDILPILPGPQIDRNYLAHYLRTDPMVRLAESRSAGANLPRLSPSALAEFPVPIPSLTEQRRIAAILDKAEALRAKRRESIGRVSSLAQKFFIEMFGDPAVNPHRFLVTTLGSSIFDGPQNGLYKPASDYGGGVPILRIDAFYAGRVTKLNCLRRLKASDSECVLYGLRKDDIVINRVNSLEYLGKSAIIPQLLEPTVFESNMMRFRVDHRIVLPTFLIEQLQTRFVQGQIQTSAKNAVNQSSINQQDVKAFKIVIPPLPLQETYVECVRAAESQLAKQLASRECFDALFASLQHRAFRGEL
jgi:type I restriction enzyme S subunit